MKGAALSAPRYTEATPNAFASRQANLSAAGLTNESSRLRGAIASTRGRVRSRELFPSMSFASLRLHSRASRQANPPAAALMNESSRLQGAIASTRGRVVRSPELFALNDQPSTSNPHGLSRHQPQYPTAWALSLKGTRMRNPTFVALALVSVWFCSLATPAGQLHTASAGVVICNGERLSNETVRALEQAYRVRVRPGAYWYDRMTGAWGYWGGPVAGVIMPGLSLGGPLAENASNGNTGIFINGRQLHQRDVWVLRQIMIPLPGRYWMNAAGTFGAVGGPPLGNIYWLANAASQRSGGSSVRRQGILSTYDKTGVAVFGY
jgi:hypothetical protein